MLAEALCLAALVDTSVRVSSSVFTGNSLATTDIAKAMREMVALAYHMTKASFSLEFSMTRLQGCRVTLPPIFFLHSAQQPPLVGVVYENFLTVAY